MSGASLTVAIRDAGTAKEIAKVGRCSEATAARWRRGETMPNPVSLARLMGWSSAIANAMLRMAGLDDLSMDLEEAQARQELRRLEARRADSAPAGSGGTPDVETAHAAAGAAAGKVVEPPGELTERQTRAMQRSRAALRDAERWRR